MPNKVTACIPYGKQCPREVWLGSAKNCIGVAFWNFQRHMVLCQETFQNAINFVEVWQITKKHNSRGPPPPRLPFPR